MLTLRRSPGTSGTVLGKDEASFDEVGGGLLVVDAFDGGPQAASVTTPTVAVAMDTHIIALDFM